MRPKAPEWLLNGPCCEIVLSTLFPWWQKILCSYCMLTEWNRRCFQSERISQSESRQMVRWLLIHYLYFLSLLSLHHLHHLHHLVILQKISVFTEQKYKPTLLFSLPFFCSLTDLKTLVNKIWEKRACCVRRKSLFSFQLVKNGNKNKSVTFKSLFSASLSIGR